jgi:poly(3-hydroxybutyrate) depolymerase
MAKGAQPMRVQNITGTADPLAGPGGGGDAAIQRLRETPNDPAAIRRGGRRQHRAK